MTLFSDRDERMLENLRILNSRFARKPRPTVARGERQSLTLRPGVLPPVVIAAVDTEEILKPYASYVGTGVNDEAMIYQAILDMNLFKSDEPEAYQQGTFGTILALNGTYTFDDDLIFGVNGYGRLRIVGDGMPKFVMSYNTANAYGVAPMISVPGGGNALNYPLIFENIQFEGANLSNAACFFQNELTTKPLMVVRGCIFTNWDKVLWWSERTSPRMFHNNQVVNCDFTDACFRFDSATAGKNLIHDNIFNNCTGNMVSGYDFAFHTLISNNVRQSGSLALNPLLGVIYNGNVF